MRRPIVGVAAHWIIGMTVAVSGRIMDIVMAALLAACFWFAAGLIQTGTEPKSCMRRVILYTSILILGAVWYMWSEAQNVSKIAVPAGNPPEIEEVTISGYIVTDPEVDGDRARMAVEISGIRFAGNYNQSLQRERLQVNVRLQSLDEQLVAAKWRRGQVFRAQGTLSQPLPATNFNAFDYQQFLRRQRIHWMFQIKGLSGVEVLSGKPWTLLSASAAVDSFRRELSARLEAAYGKPYSGFMQGLIIGMKDGVDPEQYRQFSQIGLTHILAISGLHVAIYVGTVLWLLRRLPLTRETQLVCAIAAVPLYVVLTGASPSVVRAGIMAVLSLYAARRRLLKDGLHVLSFAVITMLAWNPYYLHDVGFQLSFAVTAGLILGVPRLNELLPIKHAALRSAVSVTLAAQAVSFPLTLYYFNGFSVLSFPANLVLVPLFSFVVLPLGTVTLAASFVSPALAAASAWSNEQIVKACFWLVERMTALEGAYSIWASPPLWWIALYYVLLFLILQLLSSGGPLLYPLRVSSKPVYQTAVILFLCLIVYAYIPDALGRSASVAFLDVGQGDAILIQSASGKTVLIDGGGTLSFMKPGEEWRLRKDPYEVGRDLIVPLLKKRGIRKIDALFISHQDTDHIGGLHAVMEELPVKHIWFNGTLKRSDTAQKLFQTAVDKRIPLSSAHAGQTIQLDAETRLQILYPSPPDPVSGITQTDEQNESSLVFILELAVHRFLFAGDIDSATERLVLERLERLERLESSSGFENPGRLGRLGRPDRFVLQDIDVLKISHHGSKSSTSDEWLQAWPAKAAVISVGRNNVYGHPHPSVVTKLSNRGLAVFRTDRQGEVQFEVTKQRIRVRTKIGRHATPLNWK